MTERKRQRRAQTLHEPAAAYGGPGGEVVLYQTPDGGVTLDVRVEQDTVWLNLSQMAALFERDKSVISRHLRNIYREGELDPTSTVAFFATVQQEGDRRVTRQVEYYNLDAIISVGYRVNSRRGTQFRIWATQVLREHLVRGYTVNERRLAELRQTIRLVADVANRRALTGDEAAALLNVVRDYAYALDVLDAYDHGRLRPAAAVRAAVPIAIEEARRLIAVLRDRFQAGPLFGQEKDAGLESSLAAVFQTVGGADAYPTLEEKAARLLYFLVKNHPFVDGNKRIGAALFLVRARFFAEMLERTIRAYRNRAVESAQVIARLVEMARQMREERGRGAALGLADDEVAFYDALAANGSAVLEMGDETLKAIARDLVRTLRRSVTSDWTEKESVRARIRAAVKRLLRRYGYPPDQAEAPQAAPAPAPASSSPGWWGSP